MKKLESLIFSAFNKNSILYFALFFTLTFSGFFSIRNLIGEQWDTGSFSTKVIVSSVDLFTHLIGADSNTAIGLLVSIGFVLTAVTWSFFILQLTRQPQIAFISGLFALISPPIIFSDQRLSLGLIQYDGAHIFSLALLGITTSFYYLFLKSSKKKYLVYFSICVFVMSLLSLFSLFIVFIFLLIITLSEGLLTSVKKILSEFGVALLVLGMAIIIVYNRQLIEFASTSSGQSTLQILSNSIPISLFLVPVGGIISFIIFDRRANLTPLFIALVSTTVFGVFYLFKFSQVSVALFSQERYGAEFGLSLGFLSAVIINFFYRVINQGTFLKRVPKLYMHRIKISQLLVLGVWVYCFYCLFFIERVVQ